jgi:DNA-binding HxlR family transcriptional regulator
MPEFSRRYKSDAVTRYLERIADKWTVLIVGRLAEGTKRFGELQRELGGISQKMLTQVLRRLERDGVVKRQVYATVPPKVEYSLTPAGRTLIDLLERLRSWAIEHVSTVLAAQRRFDIGPVGRAGTSRRRAPDPSFARPS